MNRRNANKANFTDVLRRLALTTAVLSGSIALIAQSGSQQVKSGARPPFELTRVSTVHLTFSAGEFAALTPDNPAGGGGRGGFGRPGGPGAPAGQGAPAGPGALAGAGGQGANASAAPVGAPAAGRGGGRGGGLLAADGRRNGMTGAAQVDEVARAIRTAVGDESATGLVRFDRAVNGESLPALLFNGRPFGAPNPVVPIKSFAAARARAVRAQLERIEGGTQ